MASFYPQIESSESLSKQWQRYLQNKPLINNVEDIIQDQTKEYKSIIERSSKEQIQAIQESTQAVCGTLESGFELVSEHLQELSYGLSEIKSELNDMSSILDWGFTRLIEEQRITNLLLGNIAILLRIPDIQKERQYHIEQGIKFLKNSFYDKDFFADALKNLLKAETIEQTDFFTLHQIGLVYMFTPDSLEQNKEADLNKAEAYFRKAAKYSIAEINSGAIQTTNYLTSDLNTDLSKHIPSIDAIRIQAAESFLYACRSCYLLGNFNDAAELAEKAFTLVPQMLEAGFEQAQALSAATKESESIIVLKSVIDSDRFYSIKTARDINLRSKIEVRQLLESLRQQEFNKASNLLAECKDTMINESIIQDEFNYIEKLISRKTFLHSKKAIDLMTNTKERIFSDISPENNKSPYKLNRNFVEFCHEFPKTLNLFDKLGSYKIEGEKIIEELFIYLSDRLQWNLKLSKSGENFVCKYEPKKVSTSLLEFAKKEKEYYENLLSAKTYFKISVTKISNNAIKVNKENELLFAERRKANAAEAFQKKATVVVVFIVSALIGIFGFRGHTFISVLIFIPALIVGFFIATARDKYEDKFYEDRIVMALYGLCLGIIIYWKS